VVPAGEDRLVGRMALEGAVLGVSGEPVVTE
jgi:hypothetical protein